MVKNNLFVSLIWAVIGIVSVIYLTNFTFGIIEVLPDNLPLVGNLDEALVTLGLLGSIKFFTKVDVVKVITGGK